MMLAPSGMFPKVFSVHPETKDRTLNGEGVGGWVVLF